MEAIHSPSLPLTSFQKSRLTQPTTQARLPFLTKERQQQPSPSHSHLRTQALNHVSSIATSSPAPGGDISVLIPISAVLLFVYWIANFVVPGMIEKDLQPEIAQEEEEEEEVTGQANESGGKKAGMPTRTTQKNKKGSNRKMASPR